MKSFFFLLLLFAGIAVQSQPVTGIWRGKMTSGKGLSAADCKMEVKIIKNGDSLYGTSYYFIDEKHYSRYSIKGYFDVNDNMVHWQDQELRELNPPGKNNISAFKESMIVEANYNIPGFKEMVMDGVSRIGSEGPHFTLHFEKVNKTFFPDEWDNLIDQYFAGQSNINLVDSVYAKTKPYDQNDVFAKNNVSIEKAPSANPAAAATIAAVSTGTAKKESQATDIAKNQASSNQQPAQPAKTENAVEKPVVTNDTVAALKQEPINQKAIAVQPVANNTIVKEASKDLGKEAGTTIAAVSVVAVTAATKKDTVVNETTTVKPEQKLPVTTVSPPKNEAGKSATAATATVATVGAATQTKPKPAAQQPVLNNVARQNPEPNQVSTIQKPDVTAVNSQPPAVNNVPKSKTIAQPDAVVVVKKTDTKTDLVAEQLFISRKKVNQAEIPVLGDTIQLNFYDNGTVDGDSISLFLDGKLLFNHILLTTQAYSFKISSADIHDGSELTMVAENMGTIPPNTALMIAIVKGERYSSRMESTEQTSGVIKLVKRQQ